MLFNITEMAIATFQSPLDVQSLLLLKSAKNFFKMRSENKYVKVKNAKNVCDFNRRRVPQLT